MKITVMIKEGNLTKGYELDVTDKEADIIKKDTIEVVNPQFINPSYMLNNSVETKSLVEKTKTKSWEL